MIAKFIFLTFVSTSVARFGFLKEPFQAKRVECADVGSSRGNLEAPANLDFAATEKKSLIDMLKIKLEFHWILHCTKPWFQKPKSSTNQLLMSSPDRVHVTPKRNFKTNLAKNQRQFFQPYDLAVIGKLAKDVTGLDHLSSLEKDSQKLSALKLEIEEELPRLHLRMKNQPTSTTEFFLDAFNILKKLMERLEIFKQLRFLELVNIDSKNSNLNLIRLLPKGPQGSNDFSLLPEEIIQTIAKKSWINYGNSIVDDLKSVNYKLLFDKEVLNQWHTFIIWWQSGLEMIDFLWKNGFADQITVSSFFEDPNAIKQVLFYINSRYDQDLDVSILTRTTCLTDHWYWSLLHESLKVINKKQEIHFNGYVILRVRYQEIRNLCAEFKLFLFSHACSDFFQNFEIEVYLNQMMKMNESGRITSYDDHLLSTKSADMITGDVKRIVDLIANSNEELAHVPTPSKELIAFYLCEVLDFIERFIFPGIIDRISPHNPKFHEFDKKFNSLLLSSKMNDIYWRAIDYYRYIRKTDPSHWSKSKLYKSNFDAHLNQFNEVLNQFQNEGFRLREKFGNEIYETMQEVHDSFKTLAEGLTTKSHSFD